MTKDSPLFILRMVVVMSSPEISMNARKSEVIQLCCYNEKSDNVTQLVIQSSKFVNPDLFTYHSDQHDPVNRRWKQISLVL